VGGGWWGFTEEVKSSRGGRWDFTGFERVQGEVWHNAEEVEVAEGRGGL